MLVLTLWTPVWRLKEWKKNKCHILVKAICSRLVVIIWCADVPTQLEALVVPVTSSHPGAMPRVVT